MITKTSQLVCQSFYPVFIRTQQQNIPVAFFVAKTEAEKYASTINGIVGMAEVPLSCTHTEKRPHVQATDRNEPPVVLALPSDDSNK
jgi:hypothetical protein